MANQMAFLAPSGLAGQAPSSSYSGGILAAQTGPIFADSYSNGGNANIPVDVAVGSSSVSSGFGAPLLATLAGLGLALSQQRKSAKRASTRQPRRITRCAVQIPEAPADLKEQRLAAAAAVAQGGKGWEAPENDLILRAARGEKVDRAPKWMMRQAGRYLPEYQEILKTSDFFSVCRDPALAAEITIQPYRRYETLDALIIFSDILVIPVAMGMPCSMEPGQGPKFDFAVSTPEDIEKLVMKPDVHASLGYVFDAIYHTRQLVQNKIPVIGFSGAPWTLMGYMVQGGAAAFPEAAKKWLYKYPEASRKLMKALREVIVEYLVGQYDAGAPMLMLFDTNAGQLPPGVYEEFCVEDLKYIATEVKRRRPQALMTVFPKDTDISPFNDSDYDVVSVSWTSTPSEARAACPDKTLQGNADPFLLFGSEEEIDRRTQAMIKEFGVDRYIANLGHGMMPSHTPEGPAAFHAAVNKVKYEDAPRPSAK